MVAERFPIEEGHIASFARSIGDANAVFYGPDAVAPPTFVQSSAQWDPDYFLRPKIGQPWFGSGKEPTGIKRDGGSGVRVPGGALRASVEGARALLRRASDGLVRRDVLPGCRGTARSIWPGDSRDVRRAPR